jgi:hypothetical protein
MYSWRRYLILLILVQSTQRLPLPPGSLSAHPVIEKSMIAMNEYDGKSNVSGSTPGIRGATTARKGVQDHKKH